jgi:hypothetical protein
MFLHCEGWIDALQESFDFICFNLSNLIGIVGARHPFALQNIELP